MQPTAATQHTKKLLIKTAQQWLFLNDPEEIFKCFAANLVDIKTSIVIDKTHNGILLFMTVRNFYHR